MREALSKGGFETVIRLGHSMKGAGASFGFQAITDMGANLEQEAKRLDSIAVHRVVNELAAYLKRVKDGEEFAAQLPRFAAVEPKVERVHRILLIDDNDDLRAIVREFLEQSGHVVQEARDGLEGLACILTEEPDVAFVDIGLLGIDGYELARRTRVAVGDLLRLVALTGHGQPSHRLEALAAGFDAYLSKPLDIERMKKVLEPDFVSDRPSRGQSDLGAA